jgi:hypothetical protein
MTAVCGSEQFDIVLLGNILRFFPANRIQGILHKVHRTLTFGGLVVVDDGVLDEERGPAERVLLAAVDMVNAAPDAEFYTFSEYRLLSTRHKASKNPTSYHPN